MRVTRPVSLSPTRRHDWKPCTGWRLDARLTVGRCLRVTALTASLKHLPCVNTITIRRKRKNASGHDDFFLIFLKRCNSTTCYEFSHFAQKKKMQTRQKKRPKNGRRKPPNGAYPLPSTSSSKTRKKSSEIF